MRIQVAKEEKSFFEKHGWIEFDGLFSDDDIKKLARAVDNELVLRVSQSNTEHSSLESSRITTYAIGKKTVTDSEIVNIGRDLALSSPSIQKFLFCRKLSEAAYQLIEKKPLRWAFDHVVTDRYLDTFSDQDIDMEASVSVGKLLLIGAVVIDEQKTDHIEESKEKKTRYQRTLYPHSEGVLGRVLFFDPAFFKGRFSHDSRISEECATENRSSMAYLFKNPREKMQVAQSTTIHTQESHRVLLFAWSDAKPVYVLNVNDCATHQLKHYGYVFGDRLRESTHPILYR